MKIFKVSYSVKAASPDTGHKHWFCVGGMTINVLADTGNQAIAAAEKHALDESDDEGHRYKDFEIDALELVATADISAKVTGGE